MYLYNSYCYETINLAAQSFYSQGFINGFGVLQGYSIKNLDTVTFSFFVSNSAVTTKNGNGNGGGNTTTFTIASIDYQFQSCSSLGFDNSFFGVSPIDSVLVTFAVISLLAVAYYFKILRKLVV